MKKLLLSILFFLFSVSTAYAQSVGCSFFGASGGSSSGAASPVFYVTLDAEGTGGDANKVYEEVDGDWIGTENNLTFSAACVSNGIITDADTDYLFFSQAELDDNSVSYNKGTIYVKLKPSELLDSNDGEGEIISDLYGGGADTFRFYWINGYLQLYIAENWAASIQHYWPSSGNPLTWNSGQCYTVVLNWDVSDSSSALYIDGNLQTKTVTTSSAESDPVNKGGAYIGNYDNDDTKRFKGHIDEFKWYDDQYTPAEL